MKTPGTRRPLKRRVGPLAVQETEVKNTNLPDMEIDEDEDRPTKRFRALFEASDPDKQVGIPYLGYTRVI